MKNKVIAFLILTCLTLLCLTVPLTILSEESPSLSNKSYAETPCLDPFYIRDSLETSCQITWNQRWKSYSIIATVANHGECLVSIGMVYYELKDNNGMVCDYGWLEHRHVYDPLPAGTKLYTQRKFGSFDADLGELTLSKCYLASGTLSTNGGFRDYKNNFMNSPYLGPLKDHWDK